jgi:hypothetical protein
VGIVFKEVKNDAGVPTLYVKALAPGGPAQQSGLIEVRDLLRMMMLVASKGIPRRDMLGGGGEVGVPAACLFIARREKACGTP